MLEEAPKWSIDTIFKAVGAGASVVLGRELIRRWKPTRKEDLDHARALIAQLRRLVADNNDNLDSVQKRHLEEIEVYEARLSRQRENIHKLTNELISARIRLAEAGISTEE